MSTSPRRQKKNASPGSPASKTYKNSIIVNPISPVTLLQEINFELF